MRETDVAIIGAGVAGLTAAAEAAKLGLQVLVVERMGAGGQVMNVERVLGMPGFADGISGFELGPELQERAEAAGAEFMLDSVLRLEAEGGRHVLRCEGEDVAARAVIVASGSVRQKLGVPGEEALEGRGVSHCASCDGPLFRGQPVCVVGGGDSAFGEAAVLAGHAKSVYVVFPGASPHAMARLQEEVRALPNVELLAHSEVVAITGDAGVSGVRLRGADGALRELPAEGVFVYAGLRPDASFLPEALRLDAQGRVVTDAAWMASVPGVFAAGDIRTGTAYQLDAVVADGTSVAAAVAAYLET
jgi:thioredoxin reductase (NADPH)